MNACVFAGRFVLRPALGLGALGLIAACTMIPESVEEQDIARYDAAVASLGCTLVTESDYMAAGLQTGLSRAQLMDITAYKLSSDGAVRLPAGGVELTTGACA
ncbi:hypothetical protein [Roseovarius sp. D22-M7]|uniref:hypothetical protein n=1 Tax=Roseovarius sp. D22-M7 TaxID=3127116 RepID=UPI00300FE810